MTVATSVTTAGPDREAAALDVVRVLRDGTQTIGIACEWNKGALEWA